MKKKIFKEFFYNVIIFLLKFKFFKLISKYFLNAYLIDRGYSLDYGYLMGVNNENQLFKGENIFLNKLDNLNIKNCVDIGANIGEYTRKILQNKNTKVIAFEPLPECCKSLLLIKEKYKQRFIFLEYALSNKKGTSDIFFSYEHSGFASLETSINKIGYVKLHNTNKLKIKLERLDNFIDDVNFQNIDFIKIDTEGHEQKILEGGLKFVNRHKVKLIQIEFNKHNLYTNSTIFNFSEMLKDYVPTQLNLINGQLRIIESDDYLSNIYQLSNFVFVENEYFKKYQHILLK